MSQSDKLSLWQKIKRLFSMPSRPRLNAGRHLPEQGQDDSMDNDLQSRQPPSLSKASVSNEPSFNGKSSLDRSFDESVTSQDRQRHRTDTQSTLTHTSTPSPNQPVTHHSSLEDKQSAAHESTPSPLTDRFKTYLTQQNWRYTHHEPRESDAQCTHHLSMRMKNEHLNWVCLFRIQERSQLVAVYGILPFFIPESHRSAALLLTTQLNYDMMLGNIEMDLHDGEVRYKASLDIEATGHDDAVIHYLIQSVIAMTSVTYQLFKDLLDNPDPAQDIDALLGQMREQSDARTFYLPTEQIQ